jgi:hypothetical protein
MSELESYEKRIREIYPDLATKSISLNQEGLLNDVVIVVSCALGIVYLHENGRLLNAELAAPHEFTGIVVPAGERVTLGEEGELLEQSRRLAVDQPIGGLLCSAEFRVWLYPCGQPSSVVLAESSWIGDREYPRGSELFLDNTGQVLDFWVVDLDSGRQYAQRVFGLYEAPFE